MAVCLYCICGLAMDWWTVQTVSCLLLMTAEIVSSATSKHVKDKALSVEDEWMSCCDLTGIYLLRLSVQVILVRNSHILLLRYDLLYYFVMFSTVNKFCWVFQMLLSHPLFSDRPQLQQQMRQQLPVFLQQVSIFSNVFLFVIPTVWAGLKYHMFMIVTLV